MIKTDDTLYKQVGEASLGIEKTPFDGKYNKSFLFLLPLIGFNKPKYEKYFINCYYKSESALAELENSLYLLCEFNQEVHNYAKSVKDYVYNYFVGKKDGKKYHMYCYSIQNEDYFTITNSFYSLISEKTKLLYKNYNYFSNKKTDAVYIATVEGVVNKRIWLKKKLEKKLDISMDNKEYWSNFDNNLNKEIYLWQRKK